MGPWRGLDLDLAMTVRCWCGCVLPLMMMLASIVVVIADGGLGHCRFQTNSQTDECKNVKKVGKNAVRNKHTSDKVAKTRFMRVSIGWFLAKMRTDRAKLQTTPTKVWRNDSHHCHDFQTNHTKSRRFGIYYHSHHGQQSTHTYTKNERGKQGTCTQCDIPLSTTRRTWLGIMVVFSGKEGPKMSRGAVFSTSLPIICIQWEVLVGSEFLAWHDSSYLHNWIYIACWHTRQLKICLSTLIVNNTPTKESCKNQFT